MYEILFSSVVEHYFKKLKEKPLKQAYKEALLNIGENPYIGQLKHGDLARIYGIAYTIYETNGKKMLFFFLILVKLL